MTLFRDTAPERVLIFLMMMAGYAQVAEAGVLIETDSSRIETNEQGVYIQTDRPAGLPRPPAPPLRQNRLPNRYPVAPLPTQAVNNSVIHCSDGSVLTSRQRIYTERSPDSVTQSQQQTTATCQQ